MTEVPYPPWRTAVQVAAFLTAHRANLRALAVQRCPRDPRRTLAEVHMVDGQRWVWLTGTKSTPAELVADGIARDDWVTVSPSVIPLEHPRWADRKSPTTCRGCRLTYSIDLAFLRVATEKPAGFTLELPPPTRPAER